MRLFVQVAQLQGIQKTDKPVKGSTSKHIYKNEKNITFLEIKNIWRKLCIKFMYWGVQLKVQRNKLIFWRLF